MPEAHAALLLAGLVFHRMRRRRISIARRTATSAGALFVLAGLALAMSATRAAGDTELARPERLVVAGPYARSRNPMYVGWTLIYLGVSLLLASASHFVLLPALGAWVHRDVLQEEKRLDAHFGEGYRSYRRRVRRYI